MGSIYKIIREALTEQTAVFSGHTKSKNQSDFCSGMHQHHAHLAPPQRIAISALLLMVFGSGALAQQLIYDGAGGLGTIPLKTANDAVFGTTGLPAWLNVNANDQGVVYLDNNGAGTTVTTGANLLINYPTGTTPKFVVGGYSNTGAMLENNIVTLEQGAVNGPVFGGLSHVTHISADATGASSGSDTSANTSINISNTSVSANHNRLFVDAQVSGDNLYGGNATIWVQAGKATAGGDIVSSGAANASANASVIALNSTVTASNNSVTLGENARVTGSVYGGYAHAQLQVGNATAGNASGGNSTVSAVALAYVGADRSALAASRNIVAVGDHASVTGDFYGGYAQLTAKSSHAIAADASGLASITGGANARIYATNGNITASNNTLRVGNGARIFGSLYGGYAGLKAAAGTAEKGSINGNPSQAAAPVNVTNTQIFADDNEITFNGTLQNGSITGGYVQFEITQGTAINDSTLGDNSVNLNGTLAQAINNTVTIGDNAQFNSTSSSLYGGFLAYNAIGSFKPASYDVFTGNTLNWLAKAPATFQTVANFEHINFTLNPVYANQTTALITANDIVLGADLSSVSVGVTTPSKIAVVGIHSGNVLNVGDEFILMSATNSMSGSGTGDIFTGVTQAQQGISLRYDVRTDADINGKVVTATILGGGRAVSVNPQLKALSESYLAGVMLVTRGADAIADDAFSAINRQNNQNGLMPFTLFSGSYSRYNSGSHIKSNDSLLIGGLSYQQDNLTLGAFLEGGWGSYDTYNSFYNAANVHGDGNSHYYGAGLLGRYDFINGFYTDASLRSGRNRNKFNTKDIQNIASGQYVNYTVKSSYISTHFGVGYLLSLNNKNQLDLSAKYLYSTLGGKDVNVTGDPINFKRINSHRARVNTTLNHQYSEAVAFNVGLGYEHEFDGKAKATTYNLYKIDAASVKGGTGILSFGTTVKPSTSQNLSLDLKLNGYVGKREGVGASIKATYAF